MFDKQRDLLSPERQHGQLRYSKLFPCDSDACVISVLSCLKDRKREFFFSYVDRYLLAGATNRTRRTRIWCDRTNCNAPQAYQQLVELSDQFIYGKYTTVPTHGTPLQTTSEPFSTASKDEVASTTKIDIKASSHASLSIETSTTKATLDETTPCTDTYTIAPDVPDSSTKAAPTTSSQAHVKVSNEAHLSLSRMNMLFLIGIMTMIEYSFCCN